MGFSLPAETSVLKQTSCQRIKRLKITHIRGAIIHAKKGSRLTRTAPPRMLRFDYPSVI